MIFLTGDAESILTEKPKELFQCCITSPPYWGLRDYGTALWEGGSEDCNHRKNGERRQLPHGDGRENDGYVNKRVLIPGAGANYSSICGKCGARRIDQQIGLEPTPELYVRRMVKVFREVWRVLRSDGTLWLNLGDSYARAEGKGQHKPGDAGKQNYIISKGGGRAASGFKFTEDSNIKPKDLIGIPWRVALALQADGWYLRQDIIWHKPNPMPESVTDRFTRSHEHVFLLTKSERYYFNSEAIQEPAVCNRTRGPTLRADKISTNGNSGLSKRQPKEFRNSRDVWSINTQSYRGAHFATFPEALVLPCLLAGSQPGDIVLDPFMGSGTVGVVCQKHDRIFYGIDLNPEYVALAKKRNAVPVVSSHIP